MRKTLKKIRAVKGLVWTTNSEKVRLKYFKYLAEQDLVRKGINDAAVEHFLNPSKTIEAWYKTTVDQYRSESFGNSFARTFDQEFQSIRRRIENAKDCADVVSVAQKYSGTQVSLYFQPSSHLEANDNSFKIMKDEIFEIMTKNKAEFCHIDDSRFSPLSEDADVMSRIGCTDTCFLCGALCWGHRGHDSEQGETRKHHSSHQPCGLRGTHDKNTKHLLSEPCHDRGDETLVHFGEYMETGIEWHVAKVQNFSEWKFDRHYNLKFDELMRWFFFELHHSISERLVSTKPATKEDLERYNCDNLHYNIIMARIEQEIS